jgi:hypothetical protein
LYTFYAYFSPSCGSLSSILCVYCLEHLYFEMFLPLFQVESIANGKRNPTQKTRAKTKNLEAKQCRTSKCRKTTRTWEVRVKSDTDRVTILVISRRKQHTDLPGPCQQYPDRVRAALKPFLGLFGPNKRFWGAFLAYLFFPLGDFFPWKTSFFLVLHF